MDLLFEWFREFVNGCGYAWNWLTSPANILGFDIAPIFLICGSFLILGIIRAIIGVI